MSRRGQRRRRWLGIATFCCFAVGGLLAGCGTPGGVISAAGAARTGAEGFHLEGRVAVRYGDESLAGRIAWEHAPERDEVSLASPLGNQIALIVRDPQQVVLTDAQQNRYRAVDAETLTERQLGWRMPLAGMADWVRARASADGKGERDARGRLVRLDESGWQIEFSYDADASLPRRLIMSFSRGDRPLEIRLVVDTWM